MPDDPLFLFNAMPVGLWPAAAVLSLLADPFHPDPFTFIHATTGLVLPIGQPPRREHVCGLSVLPQVFASCFAKLLGIAVLWALIAALIAVCSRRSARPA
jgi:hypothetical protein